MSCLASLVRIVQCQIDLRCLPRVLCRDKTGKTPLHRQDHAHVLHGTTTTHPFSATNKNCDDQTDLTQRKCCRCCEYGNLDNVKVLLEAKADVLPVDAHGCVALRWKPVKRSGASYSFAKSKRCVCCVCTYRKSALHLAAQAGHARVVLALLAAGALAAVPYRELGTALSKV